MQNLCRNGQKMMQTTQLRQRTYQYLSVAPTVHQPVHAKTKQQNVTKLVTATISSAEIHITCLPDEQTDIIHNNNEKTKPIYTKILMNQVFQQGLIQGSSSYANCKVVLPSCEMLNRLKMFKRCFYTIIQFMHVSPWTLMC